MTNLEISLLVVAVLSLLVNAYQWITAHYQSEKGFRLAREREERQRKSVELKEARTRVYDYFANLDPSPDIDYFPVGDINWLRWVISPEQTVELDGYIESYLASDKQMRAYISISDPDREKKLLERRNHCRNEAGLIAHWINKNLRIERN